MLRTHTCGELNLDHTGQTATLCGWVDTIRDFGGVTFIDLRDRYGRTQVVFNPDAGSKVNENVAKLRNEFVVKVVGKIRTRPEGQENKKISTGQIEFVADELEILNDCMTPPFVPGQKDLPNEDLRLKHRYLDLRRSAMMDTLQLRSRIIKGMRDYCADNGFIDIETPILGRSTPEGARDYLVPSRVFNGQFYALPQSPQIYKQIMMIAGYDRYVQVARCFRDEDLRADRQPEFTQLDLEMSFVDSDDVISMIDGLMKKLAKEILDIDLQLPLPRLTYDEAMTRFGHDAPDMRFGMEIVDCSEVVKDCEFGVFSGTVKKGNYVRAINVVGGDEKYSRRNVDELTAMVKDDFGAAGLAWMRCKEDGSISAPIAKFFKEEELESIKQTMNANPGDLLLFIADSWEVSCKSLHALRKRIGAEMELYDPNEMHFSWVVQFPMFDYDDESKRWNAMHHPFTAPLEEDIPKLESAPGETRAQAYDLVINGYEAGGGTIRIHDSSIQSQVFGLLGMDEESAKERFGFLLDALKYGAPPHGGIALGIDRIVMLFGKLDNIRDCIAFPKTQRASDLMTEAPNVVEQLQLDELGIGITRTENSDSDS